MNRRKLGVGSALVALVAAVLLASPASADVISGVVYKDVAVPDTDNRFQPQADVPQAGVEVRLDEQVIDPVLGEMWIPLPDGLEMTDPDGRYSFGNRPPGTYRVVLPNLRRLPENLRSSEWIQGAMDDPTPPVPPNPARVGGTVLPVTASTEPMEIPTDAPALGPISSESTLPTPKTADAPLVPSDPEPTAVVTQGDLIGLVFLDAGLCNNAFDTDSADNPLDLAAVGRMVRLIEPPGQPAGTVLTTQTVGLMQDPGSNSWFNFVFPDALVATGAPTTTITIQYELANGEFSAPIQIAGIRVFQDPGLPDEFEYDPITLPGGCQLGSIAGRVFRDAPPADGRYTAGVDLPAAGVTLRLLDAAGAPVPGVAPATTGADGLYALGPAVDGTYRIVAAGTGVPADTALVRSLIRAQPVPANADIPLPAGDTPTCPRQSCTRGHLHEVVAVTDIWVGDMVPTVAVSATLFDGCGRRAGIVDLASVGYMGAFPGPTPGMDGILTIEDVRLGGDGWATVRVKITADDRIFPGGAFANVRRRLEVSLNGRRNQSCDRYRCENVQPGGRFGRNLFRVLATWSWDSWRECERPDAQLPGGGNGNGNTADDDDPRGNEKSAKSEKSKKSKKSKKAKKPRKSGRRR